MLRYLAFTPATRSSKPRPPAQNFYWTALRTALLSFYRKTSCAEYFVRECMHIKDVVSRKFLRNHTRQHTEQSHLRSKHIQLSSIVQHSKTLKLFNMKTSFFAIASMAIFGAMANPAPSPMGIEVIRRDGVTIVREVVSFSNTS
jgi:hypothetical protein